MSDTQSDVPNLVDRSVKRLFRDQPQVLLRLAGLQGTTVRFEDANLNIPELRADHVFIVGQEGDPPIYAVDIEYQLRPEPEKRVLWTLKWAGLCRLLRMPVLLLAVYLTKGSYATFHNTYGHAVQPLETKLTFNAVRLWEYRDRIISGEFLELAPLLVLCEEEPTEETLQKEVELIHASGLPVDVQTDLMAVALLVASRTFGRAILETIFGEDLAMLDEMENLKELFLASGSFNKWLRDPRIGAELRAIAIAEGRLQGIEQGIEEGRKEGKAEECRQLTRELLARRFGELPQTLVEQIQAGDLAWCQTLFQRAITATSLAEVMETEA